MLLSKKKKKKHEDIKGVYIVNNLQALSILAKNCETNKQKLINTANEIQEQKLQDLKQSYKNILNKKKQNYKKDINFQSLKNKRLRIYLYLLLIVLFLSYLSFLILTSPILVMEVQEEPSRTIYSIEIKKR